MQKRKNKKKTIALLEIFVALHTHNFTHHHALTPSPYHTLPPSRPHTLTLSHPPTLTPSPYHTLPPSHPHALTPSPYHTLPPSPCRQAQTSCTVSVPRGRQSPRGRSGCAAGWSGTGTEGGSLERNGIRISNTHTQWYTQSDTHRLSLHRTQ